MQAAKDSVFIALRDRLAVLNPDRTVFLEGEQRPAVAVVENEAITAAPPLAGCFYLTWAGAEAVRQSAGALRPILRLELRIDYRTRGTEANAGMDRGRALAALDLELARILSPGFTAKRDHTQQPPADLGSVVLWSAPAFLPAAAVEDELRRSATVTVFCWPEVELP